MRRLALVAALCGLAAFPAGAVAAPRALVVFVPSPHDATGRDSGPDPLLRSLERRGLAFGLMSATQGNYSADQAALDISTGTRVSPTAYDPSLPAPLALAPAAPGGVIRGWDAAVRRARSAPGTIRPGQLAAAIPGGAAFVGVAGARNVEAAAVADRRGRVAAVSLGSPATVVVRARAALRSHRLVVVALPPGPGAQAGVDALLARRAADELVVIAQQPPDRDELQLLPVAVARGTAGPTGSEAARGVTSDTTRGRGLVAGIDIPVTVLEHLGVAVPGSIRGEAIRDGEPRSAPRLEELRTRLRHVAPRRIRTLALLVVAWVVLAAALVLAAGARGRRAALRTGALAFMWVPAVVLIPAVFDPSSALVESALVVALAFALGALTDRLVPWPRAPILPVAVCLAVYTVDLATNGGLINLSMLGPNPRAGARFYGIGNELEPALPILLFIALAAGFTGRPPSRRLAALFVVAGVAIGLIIGSGYLGADVGGVITASVGTAVAALLLLPGGVTRRGVALAACVPLVAVGALALLDLATGASSHFSRSVLEVEGSSNLRDVVVRRYEFAWHALMRGLMPVVTLVAVLAAGAALFLRERLYARLPGPAWRAALAGGLAAGIAGALSNDSGPLLFVVAVFVLGLATAYLQGEPAPAGPGTAPAPARGARALESREPDGPPAPRRSAAKVP